MKVAIAQICSKKGDIDYNIKHHIRFIELAIRQRADAIFFPELSLSNYEPTIAKSIAWSSNDTTFKLFSIISHKYNIRIGVGFPTPATPLPKISMLIYQPNKAKITYSKQHLHEGELPYFSAGKTPLILPIEQEKIAFGICYETLLPDTISHAKKHGASIFLASVAKPQSGLEQAYTHFPNAAKSSNIPILMSNALGRCDTFNSVGQSAVWDKNGHRLAQLNATQEGIIVYDTLTYDCHVEYL